MKGVSCQGLEEGQSSASPTSRRKQYTMSLNFSAWPWFENATVELNAGRGLGRDQAFSVQAPRVLQLQG